MPLIVRPIEETDYPRSADIHNCQNEPDMMMSAEQMKQRDDADYSAIPEYSRCVADLEGRIVGTAKITPKWGSAPIEPHRYWVLVTSHEDFRHQGVDSAMLRWLLGHHPR